MNPSYCYICHIFYRVRHNLIGLFSGKTITEGGLEIFLPPYQLWMLNNYGNHYLFSEFKWGSISTASSIRTRPGIPLGIYRLSHKKPKTPQPSFVILIIYSHYGLFISKRLEIKVVWKSTISSFKKATHKVKKLPCYPSQDLWNS